MVSTNLSGGVMDWIHHLDELPTKASPESAFLARAFSVDNDGIIMSALTVALTLFLELCSLSAVRGVWHKKGGQTLYAQGMIANVVNNCILGPAAYELVNNTWMSPPFSFNARLRMIGYILIGHAIGYYLAHRWMHTRAMYWAHRFHHKFNTFVTPTTANAVSLAEYTIAYMLPFIAGAALLKPDRFSMFFSVMIISLNNLLIHTPKLADASAAYLPSLFVSTADHLEHHKRLTTHYAAPTISVDRILAACFGKPESWNKQFEAEEQVPETKKAK